MNIEERAEKAAKLKMSGYNCCQAVAAALADETNLSEDDLMKLSAGFAVGMGTMEATCGALVGANIIAGLRTEGQGTVRQSAGILRNFKERCGATVCKDLKAMTDGKPLCPCEDCCRNAVRAYGEVFNL